MVLITLSEGEIQLIENHGLDRYAKRVKQGRVTRKDGSACNAEQDITGAGAEWAVGRHYDWTPNFDILEYGDNGFDFFVHGKKIDVKWTSNVNQKGEPRTSVSLIVNPNDQPSDIYISVTGSLKKGYRILGWTTRKRLEELPKHCFGYGLKYAMPEKLLNPPITLLAYLRNNIVPETA